MITRTVKVGSMEEIKVSMAKVPGIMDSQALDCLEMVLRSQPSKEVWKRTPLATARRYDWYNRKDGKRSRTGHVSGNTGALRNTVANNHITRRVNNMTLTFGSHAEGKLDYAGYVHEARKPREGQYWHEGMRGYGRGWTTKDTGNQYVTRAVEHYADWIPEKLTVQIDKRLKEAGA